MGGGHINPDTELDVVLLREARAKMFARQVSQFGLDAEGDFSLVPCRVRSGWTAWALTLRAAERSHDYRVFQEPFSGRWMALSPEQDEPDLSWDLFDIAWRVRPFSFSQTRDELLAILLLAQGYLAPHVSTRRAAIRTRLQLGNAHGRWQDGFLLDSVNTEACSGCSDCTDDRGEVIFHRVWTPIDD